MVRYVEFRFVILCNSQAPTSSFFDVHDLLLFDASGVGTSDRRAETRCREGV